MKSFDLHVHFNREGRPLASCNFDGKRHPAVELTNQELDVLADIATRCACRDAAAKAPKP